MFKCITECLSEITGYILAWLIEIGCYGSAIGQKFGEPRQMWLCARWAEDTGAGGPAVAGSIPVTAVPEAGTATGPEVERSRSWGYRWVPERCAPRGPWLGPTAGPMANNRPGITRQHRWPVEMYHPVSTMAQALPMNRWFTWKDLNNPAPGYVAYHVTGYDVAKLFTRPYSHSPCYSSLVSSSPVLSSFSSRLYPKAISHVIAHHWWVYEFSSIFIHS